jgi:lysophospholipase L1-like esterase
MLPKNLIAAILVRATICFMAFVPFASAATYRIMPVGDSITAGYTNNPTWSQSYDFGYRGKLYNTLTTNGIGVNYVGASAEPLNNAFPVTNPPITVTPTPNLQSIGQDKHEGYGGKKTDYFASNMSGILSANNPDVILLMVGINDFTRGAPLSSAQTSLNAAMVNLNATVRTIVNSKPNAKLIIAQTIPPTTFTPAINAYNDFIENRLVPAYAAQGKFVTTVDQHANFLNSNGTVNTSLYSNGINHPNAAGYTKMATTWYEGIQAIDLDATSAQAQAAAQAANLVQNGGFETPTFGTNSHNVNPSNTGWTYTSGTAGAGAGIDRGNSYGSGSGAATADGTQMAFLQSSGNGSVTKLSQEIDGLIVGHQYNLTFQAKAVTTLEGANPFRVQMSDGTSVLNLFDNNLITPLATGYLPYSTRFVATDDSMTLTFLDTGQLTAGKVSWIDSVVIREVSVVPEPATITSVCIALTMMALPNVRLRMTPLRNRSR